MDKGRKRKISEENRVFNDTWTESFAFTTDKTGLPVCLICSEKFANNKKSNIARHFQNKHTAFAEKYPDGDERRKAVAELMRKVDKSRNNFKKWVKSANSTTYASVLAAQEIVKHGKPFTDGEYIKEAFIKISEHLYVDFKNKNDIVQKIKDMPLSVCEQVFSNMNYIKNKYQSRLRDDSLQASVKMKVTSYSPDVQTLCTEVQEQKSH